jgi:hypothetical protein
MKTILTAGAALVALATATAAGANNGDPNYLNYDGGMVILQSDGNWAPLGGSSHLNTGFAGLSQRDVRALQGNLSAIPPDTMGAIGKTQFMETSNGAYAIYDKQGNLLSKVADGVFWNNAGQADSHFANGDSRVLYDSRSNRWVVESFGTDDSKIQIAVSDTSNALGSWHSTSFTGFAGGIADYPTLAIDNKAIYIGTNDFVPNGSGGFNFAGTTLNVISRSDIFGAGGPQVTSLKQFNTTLGQYLSGDDRGFAIQGVNQVGNTDSGAIVAIGALNYGSTFYRVTNPGTAGATETPFTLVDPNSPYDPNNGARQPDGSRVIDPLDDRLSSAVWEVNGHIYTVHTITPTGSDHTAIEWNVLDAATGLLIQKGLISDPNYDYFEASLAVNQFGQVMMGYNRSGFGADGNVSFFAQGFNPLVGGNGAIYMDGAAILLYVSPIDDYHNGSPEGSPPAGRQRWGDYSQVTVDPTDPRSFWLIGEYALGYDSPTSFSRWGTWISNVSMAAPEPNVWALMISGLGLAGAALRRRLRPARA